MEILSVTLKNFKSHSDRHFTFQPGTNAICGENGAGKTSILEAIAWVLFNYRGSYKNEDLIRNGAASGQARIAFISSRDGRTYEIQRCTSKGYTLFDPQLNERLPYSHIEDEVIPWLRQHLGVAPGTDLGKLFANTIGVPQGTFTADFLQAPEKRKPIFDVVLKVEEYRQTNQQMLSLEKYAKSQVESLERAIAQYDDSLKELAPLSLKQQDLRQEIEQVQTELQQWQQRLAALQTERDQLSAQAIQMQQIVARSDTLTSQIQGQTQLAQRLQLEREQAQQAVALCTEHRTAYQTVLQAEESLKELEQRRRTQDTLLKQRQVCVEQIRDRQTQLATLHHQLENLTAATVEIERLAPLVQQQAQLEQQQQSLTQQLQTCQTWRHSIQTYRNRQNQIQERSTKLIAEINRLMSLADSVQQISALEQQQHRCQQQLSRIAAARQFELDLRQIVVQAQERSDRHTTLSEQAINALDDIRQAVPLLATNVEFVLTTLQAGGELYDHLIKDLQAILKDLAEQISVPKLEQQLQQLDAALKTARQHQIQLASLETLQAEQASLLQESTMLQTSLEDLQQQLAAEAELQQHQTQVAATLMDLNDPRGQSRLLQQQLQQQPALMEQYQSLQQALADRQSAIAELDRQLATLTDLADQMDAQRQLRDTHRPAYQIYLEHQQLANSYRSRNSQWQEATTQLQRIEQDLAALNQQRDRLADSYDPAHFQAVEVAYQQANDQKNYLSGSLPEMVKRLEDLNLQLETLQTIQAKRTAAQADLKRQTKVERFIKFARKAYKEAGPRITERYIQRISREADRLFRELLNRPNVGLEWTRDYEIVVQEGAHSRRFINLSGGEQMCAALAVRLALLKVLADINIAFFDEPTTNMDRPRREQLAEAIANIKTFRQLFVISHDDTFEQVTENVILVERETSAT